MITYITKDGDVLDFICWKYYGKTSGSLEKVLEANRHLAELVAIFSAGVKIVLPDLAQEEETESVKPKSVIRKKSTQKVVQFFSIS